MRAKIVHVTDHALLRWTQRVSETGNVFEIKQAIQKSRVIKKCEPLPYPLPRVDGSVYSVDGEVMFIMEPITIDEYRLVTVIASFAEKVHLPRKISKEEKQKKLLKKKNLQKEIQKEKKIKEEKSHVRSPRNRSKTRPIQSIVARVVSKRDTDLQHPIEQDSAA